MRDRVDTERASEDAGGLDALAWGLCDAGVEVVTGYPGFHAHELVERCGGTFSVNERTAYAVAWGASLAGIRSAVAFKNVGLNDAADPFRNSMLLRTVAGMTVVVFDDVEVAGSQCRQDSRHFFDLCPGLWLEPVSARHAYWCARTAPALAERFGVPIVLRVTNRLVRSCGRVTRGAAPGQRRPFHRDPTRAVAHPVNVRLQTDAAAGRQREVARFVERLLPASPTGSGSFLTVRAGACGLLDGSAQGASHCTVWTYPLPETALRRRLRLARVVDVFEQGSPFVCEKVRALASMTEVRGRDLAADVDHTARYHISSEFDPLYQALRSFPDRLVCGDLGSFTMDSAQTIDACLCYGASVAVAVGCGVAQHPGPVFCVTGDAAFLHSGQGCLDEGQRRGVQVTVVLLDNGGARSTGGQTVPGCVRIPPGIPVISIDHKTATVETYRAALGRLCGQAGMSVLHTHCQGVPT